MALGARNAAMKNHKSIAECLADEIMNCEKDSPNSYAIKKKDEIEKFEYFEILSMITWGLWALKRSPEDNDGKNALLKAINLGTDKKL